MTLDLFAPTTATVEVPTAVFSPCERYRYGLTWPTGDVEGEGTWLSISINPSTATAQKTDHTIRKDVGFATRHRCARVSKLNLFGFRSTDPMGLLSVDDPIGEGNDAEIRRVLAQRPRFVVCAWGAWTGRIGKLVAARAPVVLAMIRDAGIAPLCLGRSGDGSPRHPLMLAYATQLEPFTGGGA